MIGQDKKGRVCEPGFSGVGFTACGSVLWRKVDEEVGGP